MSFRFNATHYKTLSKILGVKPKITKNNVRFEIKNKENNRKLALEIYSNIRIGSKQGNLVSVYTPNAHLQLHFCSGFVVSEMLNEITFIGEHNGKLSGLIIEKEAGCSLYANVDRHILSGDLTQMGPEVMLSSIALSLTEPILPLKKPQSKRRK